MDSPIKLVTRFRKRLLRSGFNILELNEPARTLTIQETMKLLDWFLWSWRGDKVVFQSSPGGDNETYVNVYGIPNLLRVGIRKGEKFVNKKEMTRAFDSL
jgi:hypothetical protein